MCSVNHDNEQRKPIPKTGLFDSPAVRKYLFLFIYFFSYVSNRIAPAWIIVASVRFVSAEDDYRTTSPFRRRFSTIEFFVLMTESLSIGTNIFVSFPLLKHVLAFVWVGRRPSRI